MAPNYHTFEVLMMVYITDVVEKALPIIGTNWQVRNALVEAVDYLCWIESLSLSSSAIHQDDPHKECARTVVCRFFTHYVITSLRHDVPNLGPSY